jgi:hypothetical protein
VERDLRATLSHDRIAVVDWVPWIAGPGPSRRLLADHAARSGCCFADLEVVRLRDVASELVVVPLAGSLAAARPRLIAWAALVGYSRLWLPGELVPLDPACGGEVAVRCPSCAAVHVEDSGHFWQTTRMNGRFPVQCPLCGGSLPQWEACGARDGHGPTTPVAWTAWPSSR